MNTQTQIFFLLELLSLLNELQELVNYYYQDLMTEPDEGMFEPVSRPDDVPF